MCVDHLILPGTVAAGEFGLDHHCVQSPERRSNNKEFLILMVKKLVSDARLKNLPLVLHVHEARKTDEEAASQCNGGSVRSTCTVSAALSVLPIFGLTPSLMSNLVSALRTSQVSNPVQHFCANCDLKYIMLETDAPSLYLEPFYPNRPKDDREPLTTPQYTYEVTRLPACEVNL